MNFEEYLQLVIERAPRGESVVETFQSRFELFKSGGLADKHFEVELCGEDRAKWSQRIWEINLACHLIGHGYEVISNDVGPDFKATKDGFSTWLEAISPMPMGLPEEYLEPGPEGVVRVISAPMEEVLLRVTSALFNKKKKHDEYLEKGIVGEDEPYVVCVGCEQLGSLAATGISTHPVLVEAVYAVGPQFLSIDRDTAKAIDQGFSHRPFIEKKGKNGTVHVPTDVFLTDSYKGVSGAISAKSTLWGLENRVFVHNPMATNKAQEACWGVDDELSVVFNKEGNGYNIIPAGGKS